MIPSWLYRVAIGVSFLSSLFFGARNQSASMTGAIVLTLGLLTFASIPSLQSFKAGIGGVEAVTREAKDTIKALRHFAKVLAKITLFLLARRSRLTGASPRENRDAENAILNALRELDVDQVGVDECKREGRYFDAFDYAQCITDLNVFPGQMPQAAQKIRMDFREECEAQWSANRHVDPKRIRCFLSDLGMLTPDRETLIEDYEHYLKCGEHRDFERWISLHTLSVSDVEADSVKRHFANRP